MEGERGRTPAFGVKGCGAVVVTGPLEAIGLYIPEETED